MANSIFLGTGNVDGPASAVDGNVAVFDGTTGKLIKDGGSGGAFVSSITGTANQITASAATGAVTLSMPAAIGNFDSFTFSGGQSLVGTTATEIYQATGAFSVGGHLSDFGASSNTKFFAGINTTSTLSPNDSYGYVTKMTINNNSVGASVLHPNAYNFTLTLNGANTSAGAYGLIGTIDQNSPVSGTIFGENVQVNGFAANDRLIGSYLKANGGTGSVTATMILGASLAGQTDIGSNATTPILMGSDSQAEHRGSGAVTTMTAAYAGAVQVGPVTTVLGTDTLIDLGGNTAITDVIGSRIRTVDNRGAFGTITTAYGLKIEDVAWARATTNYALYTGAGLVRFGGNVTAPLLQVGTSPAQNTTGIGLPNTVWLWSRNAAGNADVGLVRATTSDLIEFGTGVDTRAIRPINATANTYDIGTSSGTYHSLFLGTSAQIVTANASTVQLKQATAQSSAMSGATATLSNLIPAGSLVVGVTVHPTTAITSGDGATTYTVGDGTTANRWGTGILFANDVTLANAVTLTPAIYPAATSVVLTATGGTFNAGVVRVTVHYMTVTAATS